MGRGQRHLGQLAVGDVASGAHQALKLAGRIEHRIGTVAHPADQAVRAVNAVFNTGIFSGFVERLGRFHHRQVFSQDGIDLGARLGIEALAAPAPDFFIARADIAHPALADIDVVEHVLDVCGQFAKARLAAHQRFLGAGALQRQCRQPGDSPNQQLVGRLRPAGHAAVHGKSRQHFTVGCHHRGAPAGQQAVGEQQFPKILHQRVTPHILDDDALAPKGCGSASAHTFGDLQAVGGLDEFRRQAGRYGLAQFPALRYQQGAQAVRCTAFNQPQDGFHRRAHRCTAGDQHQHFFLRCGKAFCGPDVGHIDKHRQGAKLQATGAQQGPGVYLQGTVRRMRRGKNQVAVIDAGTRQSLQQRAVRRQAGAIGGCEPDEVSPLAEHGVFTNRRKELAHGLVEQQETVLGVDGDHAFAHAVEDQVKHGALGIGLLQGSIEFLALRLQRRRHAVEGQRQLADLVLRRSAQIDTRQKVASGDFVGFLQDGIGRIDHQAPAHRPGAGHAEARHEQQSGQIGHQQRTRRGNQDVAWHADGHEQPAAGAANGCVGIHLFDAAAIGRLGYSGLPQPGCSQHHRIALLAACHSDEWMGGQHHALAVHHPQLRAFQDFFCLQDFGKLLDVHGGKSHAIENALLAVHRHAERQARPAA